MKRPRLLATIMVAAAAFLVTGCGVDVEDHPRQLAAAEDRIHDAVVEAGSPGVTDAGVSVVVDNYVALKMWLTVDEQSFDDTALCRSVSALVETVPFDTIGILQVGIGTPQGESSLDARSYLTRLGVTEFLNEFGRPSTGPEDGSYIWWKDAQAIAASCP